MYQFVKSLLMRIVTNLTVYHVVSMVVFWLLRLLGICSSQSDLRGHVTKCKTQFLPWMRSYWLVGLSDNSLATIRGANLPLERQILDFYANLSNICVN